VTSTENEHKVLRTRKNSVKRELGKAGAEYSIVEAAFGQVRSYSAEVLGEGFSRMIDVDRGKWPRCRSRKRGTSVQKQQFFTGGEKAANRRNQKHRDLKNSPFPGKWGGITPQRPERTRVAKKGGKDEKTQSNRKVTVEYVQSSENSVERVGRGRTRGIGGERRSRDVSKPCGMGSGPRKKNS